MATLNRPIDVIFFNSKPTTKEKLMTAKPPTTVDPVRETLNEVWRDAYETDAAMAFDDFRCCARIKSLADDRKCWMSNAKVLQKELNKLEGKVNELEGIKETIEGWNPFLKFIPPETPTEKPTYRHPTMKIKSLPLLLSGAL